MELISERIKLRPFNKEDLKRLHEWRNDPEIRLLSMMHPYPVSLQNDESWLDSVIADTSNTKIVWAVENIEDTLLIGYFQFSKINLIHRNASLGIIIGDKKSRGKGLGKEIMILGLKYAFDTLGLNKVSLDVIEINYSAIKLYKEIGFIEEGRFKDHFFFNGKWYSVVRMAYFATK
jgi:UDP-4-amino-4,6-dideoxy-N-acetyl-beta-L-altrosamine N-acetyltransferase